MMNQSELSPLSTSRVRGRVRTLAVVVLLGSLALTGCGPKGDATPGAPSTPAESRTTLPPQTIQIAVAVGESAQLGLGSLNPSVGDNWGVVSQQPSGLVEARTVTGDRVFGHTPSPSEASATGLSTVGAIQITGLKPGTTKLKVIYCYRSEVREGCDQGYAKGAEYQPKIITVTVH